MEAVANARVEAGYYEGWRVWRVMPWGGLSAAFGNVLLWPRHQALQAENRPILHSIRWFGFVAGAMFVFYSIAFGWLAVAPYNNATASAELTLSMRLVAVAASALSLFGLRYTIRVYGVLPRRRIQPGMNTMGIYSYDSLEPITEALQRSQRYRWLRPYLRRLGVSIPPEQVVVGRVALWGEVIEHERGAKGTYAYPLSIDYAVSDDGSLVAADDLPDSNQRDAIMRARERYL